MVYTTLKGVMYMFRKNKGNVKMTTLTLKELESRVTQNSKQYKTTVDQVTSQIKKQDLKQGRVRPRNPIEARILSRFTRK